MDKDMLMQIERVYEHAINHYKERLDLSLKTTRTGGNFYGSTELFSTRGVMFEIGKNFTKHDPYSSTHYDYVVKVGSRHASSFKSFKDEFLAVISNDIENILIDSRFVKEKRFFVKDDIRAIFNYEVGYGTNYSTYCGLSFSKRSL